VAVAIPGMTVSPSSMQRAVTDALKPGVTMNRAPAPAAKSACFVVRTVPAPDQQLGVSG
jgi:hypothetical protein